MAIRTVKRLVKAKPTLEGAGVHLHRAFGFGATSDTDPFLLLDDFWNEEMPKGDPDGRMHGFHLWANLPSSLKMTAPRYQDVKAGDVPRVVDDGGADVRVVCGSYRGTKGTVDDLAAKPVYLDVAVPAGKRKVLPVDTTHEGGTGRPSDLVMISGVHERTLSDGPRRDE